MGEAGEGGRKAEGIKLVVTFGKIDDEDSFKLKKRHVSDSTCAPMAMLTPSVEFLTSAELPSGAFPLSGMAKGSVKGELSAACRIECMGL